MTLEIIDNRVVLKIDAKDTAASQAQTAALRAEGAANRADATAQLIKATSNIVIAGSVVLSEDYVPTVMLFTANFPVTCTVPAGLRTSVGFDVRYYRFEGKQMGTGKVTIVPGEGVTLRAMGEGTIIRTIGQYSTFYVEGLSLSEYLVRGDIEVV